ncbi:MAG: phosphatase PAP2 family protein [Bacteroidales bacterium]
MDTLNQIDTRLFLFLNGLHSETFDHIMVWVSGKLTWWPFYLVLLAYLVWSGRLQVIPLILFIALCITLADQSSVRLFKEVFERLRPCHEPALEGMVHLVNDKCGGMYGFVSSHAANSFGVATLLLLVVRRRLFTIVILFWAALVSYSRIYLGVHYPGDIIGGAVLGMFCGYLVYLLFRWAIPRLPASWNMHDRSNGAGK